MKLQSFAENNKVTTGKFTIGDEKVTDYARKIYVWRLANGVTETQRVYACRGKLSQSSYFVT